MLEGANNTRFEIWLDEQMRPHTIPFHKPGNRQTFEKQIAMKVLDDIEN